MRDGTVAELRKLLGTQGLWKFLAIWGGHNVRFTKHPRGETYRKLVCVIGAEAAEQLRRHFAGQSLHIPLDSWADRKQRDSEIAVRLRGGESVEQIARGFFYMAKLSPRQVRRIKTKANL